MTDWQQYQLISTYLKYDYTWQELAVWGTVSLSGWLVALRYWLKYRRLLRPLQTRQRFPVIRR